MFAAGKTYRVTRREHASDATRPRGSSQAINTGSCMGLGIPMAPRTPRLPNKQIGGDSDSDLRVDCIEQLCVVISSSSCCGVLRNDSVAINEQARLSPSLPSTRHDHGH